jgi:disulfide bond formation protein DsbB
VSTEHPPPERARPTAWAWQALFVALAASAGSVYLSAGLGLKPCPLCLYQRAFAFASLGVLLVGLHARYEGKVALGALVLPLSLAGLGVAGYHTRVEQRPPGALLGSVPRQSLLVFAVLTTCLLLDLLASRGPRLRALLLALAAGAALAAACVLATPAR